MRSLQDMLIDFRGKRSAIDKLVADMPRIIGNESVKAVKENFKRQGYDNGQGFTTWEPRKESTNASYKHRQGVKGSVYNASNPILLQTRNLYNSIKYFIQGKTVIVGIDLTLVPYGKSMNEGNKSKNIPARQFIPKPEEGINGKILLRVKDKFEYERDKIMKL